MVFTEDRILIKLLRQNTGYSARRLIKEFPLKNWTKWRFEETSEEN